MYDFTEEQKEVLAKNGLSDYAAKALSVITDTAAKGLAVSVYPMYGSDTNQGIPPEEQQARAGQATAIYDGLLAAIKEDFTKCNWQYLYYPQAGENPVKLFPFPVPMDKADTPQTDAATAGARADILSFAKQLAERFQDLDVRMYLLGTYSEQQYGQQYLYPEVTETLMYSQEERDAAAAKARDDELYEWSKESYGLISAAELLRKDLPPVEWLADGLIQTVGVGVLGGAEKAGKSFFAMQLAVSISQGKPFLNRETKQTGVLYIDLDQKNESRNKGRLEKLAGDCPNIVYQKEHKKGTYFPSIADTPDTFAMVKGLMLQAKRDRGLHIGLVIIDVYADILPLDGKGNQDAYRQGRKEMRSVVQFADTNNVFVLLVHHTNKGKNEDTPFHMLSGSTALFSNCDAGILLSRSAQTKETYMYVSGRDQESDKHILQFHTDTCTFEYRGTADEYKQRKDVQDYMEHPIRQALTFLLDANGGIEQGLMKSIIADYERLSGKGLAYDPVVIGRWISQNEDNLREIDKIKFTKGRASYYTITKG